MDKSIECEKDEVSTEHDGGLFNEMSFRSGSFGHAKPDPSRVAQLLASPESVGAAGAGHLTPLPGTGY